YVDEQRHIADLIQKQRSVVRLSKKTLGAFDRSGKRALFMTKKLALEQSLWNCGAVDRDESFVFAVALKMNRLRDQLLAGAAFAVDVNSGIGLGNARYRFQHFLHLIAFGDDVRKIVFLL